MRGIEIKNHHVKINSALDRKNITKLDPKLSYNAKYRQNDNDATPKEMNGLYQQ